MSTIHHSKIDVNTWKQLQRQEGVSGEIGTIQLTGTAPNHNTMVLFKDHRGHLHCALEIPNPVASITNHRLRGMQCGTSTYTIKGKGRTHLIDLVCSLDGFAKEFTAVTKDVAHEVLHNGRGPVDAVTKVLRNWVTFWGQMRGAVLSEDKIIGLYCELLILEAVIAVDPESAMAAWQGPEGHVHDFSFNQGCIEVKGTKKSKRVHTISSIEQLVPPDHRTLHIASHRLSDAEPGAGRSIVELEKDIRASLTHEPVLETRFGELLLAVGYHPAQSENYSDFRYHVEQALIHLVDEGFPCLTPKHLQNPLPFRIEKVKYDIDLEGLAGLHVNDFQWSDMMA